VLYLDSSALIKHYQNEDGAEALERKLKVERDNSRIAFTSVLTYAEIMRLLRDGEGSSCSPPRG
jgi:predicted nucleic acid-binding protein